MVANKLTLQIILTIVVTSVVITVLDNVVDSQRLDEASRQGAQDREMFYNQTRQEQEELQRDVDIHTNYTKTILDKLTSGVNRQEEIVDKLDQIINQTSKP